MSNLKSYGLSELASFKYGKTIIKKNIQEVGEYPVFSGYKIVGYLPSYMFDEPQLIIVCRGEGGTGDIKFSPAFCSITNLSIVISCDEKIVDKGYLYWRLKLSDTNSLRTGSAQAQITINTLEKFEIEIEPNVDKQKEIARILFDLNDKIQLNRKTNQTLEHIAQAIFKSWFVDFEPVKAKIAAKQAGKNAEQIERAAIIAISGKTPAELEQLPSDTLQQLKTTAALFPDTLVDSELGEIPEGWDTKQFGELLSKTIGGDWGKDKPDDKHTEKVKILRGTDLPHVYAGSDERVPVRYVDPKKLASRKLEAGDIVIEVSGGSPTQPTGRSLYLTKEIIKRLDEDLEPASFCRLFRPVDNKIGLMLGLHLKKIYADGKTWQYQNQSTGISNFQTKIFLEKELVIIPSKQLISSFYRLIMPYMQKLSSAENNRLIKLRDTLLPKLLSGELSVMK